MPEWSPPVVNSHTLVIAIHTIVNMDCCPMTHPEPPSGNAMRHVSSGHAAATIASGYSAEVCGGRILKVLSDAFSDGRPQPSRHETVSKSASVRAG